MSTLKKIKLSILTLSLACSSTTHVIAQEVESLEDSIAAPDVITRAELENVARPIRFIDNQGEEATQIDIYVGNTFKRLIGISSKAGSQRYFFKPVYQNNTDISGFSIYVGTYEGVFVKIDDYDPRNSDKVITMFQELQDTYRDVSDISTEALNAFDESRLDDSTRSSITDRLLDANEGLNEKTGGIIAKITGPVLQTFLRQRQLQNERVSSIGISMAQSTAKLSTKGVMAFLGLSILAIAAYQVSSEFQSNLGALEALDHAFNIAELAPYLSVFVGVLSLKASLAENPDAINIRAGFREIASRAYEKIVRLKDRISGQRGNTGRASSAHAGCGRFL